ncbi:EF-hand domain-containing protein [Diaphorobacter sp. HDW4A]|uniref:EF-hand domain-containing protein n=1 Tax=Diaphorobacter sp. HDW4A TaxID=2714924 RepID=UPI00140D1264|nr:EF-hand domain-containing protein [Diaphorobacter sp. HDW4A]QIL81685.1 EF-hand domain-containing protein [Diaphorobacter sp. HDW4A]
MSGLRPHTLIAVTSLAAALIAAPWANAKGPQQIAAEAPQAQASAPLSKGELKAIREFNMLDFNGDGKLNRKEVAIIPRLAAAFDDADTNKDNFVTLDEIRAYTVKYRTARDKAKAEAAASKEAAAASKE